MKTSIAMATYNGEKYLGEQLESFLLQTRLPDELIICDDMSTDGTIDILDAFARKSPFRVEIIRNKKNIGYVKNFEQAILACTGDLIFLSDQDDVWFKQKIEVVEKRFDSNTNVFIVVNNQEIVDKNLIPIGITTHSVLRGMGFSESQFGTGCCMAIKRDILELVTPFPELAIAHDWWINLIASALEVKEIFPIPLQYYRRHDENASEFVVSAPPNPGVIGILSETITLKDTCDAWNRQIEVYREIDKAIERGRGAVEALGLSSIANALLCRQWKIVIALEQRIRVLQQRRPKRFFLILHLYKSGFYNSFKGWKSALKDVLR